VIPLEASTKLADALRAEANDPSTKLAKALRAAAPPLPGV